MLNDNSKKSSGDLDIDYATSRPTKPVIDQLPCSAKGKIDFAIITIREDEFEAVLERFAPEPQYVKGHRFFIVRVDLERGDYYQVAIARSTDQGEGPAQDLARDMIEQLAPEWLLVVGIAGGVPDDDFTLGDVVVAKRLLDFSVKAVNENKPPEYDVRGWAHPLVEQLCAALPAMRKKFDGGWNNPKAIGVPCPGIQLDQDGKFYGDDAWIQRVKTSLTRHFKEPRAPRYTTAVIAATEELVKSPTLVQLWLQDARSLRAVEMELAGVYQAAKRVDHQYPVLAIRGISDIVGFKRDPGWTTYACHSAAAFAYALVRSGFIKSSIASQAGKFTEKLPSNYSDSGQLRDYDIYCEEFAAHLKAESTIIANSLQVDNYLDDYIRLNAIAKLHFSMTNASEYEKNASGDLLESLHNIKFEKVLLLAEAGGGKTTTIKRFAWELATQKPRALPIYISLGKCETKGLINAISSELKKYGGFSDINSENDLQALLSKREGYIFFDGLNEINKNYREKVLIDLCHFLENFHPQLVVISGRLQLQNEEIVGSLAKYIDRCFLILKLDTGTVEHHIPGPISVRVRELAKNPSLLAMIKHNLDVKGSRQIRNQSDIFAAFVYYILGKDEGVGIGKEIDRETKIRLLSLLAYELNRNSELHFSIDDAGKFLSRELKSFHLEQFIEIMVNHGLLLAEEDRMTSQISYAFSPNLMMQEYFAALKLLELVRKRLRTTNLKEFFALTQEKNSTSKTLIREKLSDIIPNSTEIDRFAKEPWWFETFILLVSMLENEGDKVKDSNAVLNRLIAKLANGHDTKWLAYYCLKYGIQRENSIDEDVRLLIGKTHKIDNEINEHLKLISPAYPLPAPGFERLLEIAGDSDFFIAKIAYEGLHSKFKHQKHALIRILNQIKGEHQVSTGIRRMKALLGELDHDNLPIEMIQVVSPLRKFWISKYPITNLNYKNYIESKPIGLSPKHWENGLCPNDKNNHPVTNISWNDAVEYCVWLSYLTGYPIRLPMESEWVLAALGTNSSKFPWGNEPNRNLCNMESNDTTPVNAFPDGRSLSGCWDMFGNVNEWCFPSKNNMLRNRLGERSTMPILGWSFKDNLRSMSGSCPEERLIHSAYDDVGFRIVISMKDIVKLYKDELVKESYGLVWIR